METSVKKDPQKVTDRMKMLCSRREYCRADILKKAMTSLDGDREMAEEIVEALVADRYIDDFRYASAFARDKSSIAGWGTVKIRHMLSAKGIERNVIDAALSEIDAGKSASRLEKLMANKARSLAGDPQARLKLLRYGLARGYCYEEVTEVVDKLK